MKARLYLRLYALWRRAGGIGEAAFTGFWLGVLSRRTLHAIDEVMYRRGATYRSDEHNTRGLFPWESEAIGGYFGSCRRLLVIGAGGGREVLALASMGYETHGFECNPALVEYAQRFLKERGVQATVMEVGRDEVPSIDGPFDGIVVGWSAYMLIIGRRRRIAFLRGLHLLAGAGSPLLVSFFSRPDVNRRLDWTARIASAIRRVRRRPPVQVGDDLAPNYVHRFTAVELSHEFREGGFNLACFHPQGEGRYDSGYAVGTRAE